MDCKFNIGPYDDDYCDYVEPPTPEDDDGDEDVAPEDSDPDDDPSKSSRE